MGGNLRLFRGSWEKDLEIFIDSKLSLSQQFDVITKKDLAFLGSINSGKVCRIRKVVI